MTHKSFFFTLPLNYISHPPHVYIWKNKIYIASGKNDWNAKFFFVLFIYSSNLLSYRFIFSREWNFIQKAAERQKCLNNVDMAKFILKFLSQPDLNYFAFIVSRSFYPQTGFYIVNMMVKKSRHEMKIPWK